MSDPIHQSMPQAEGETLSSNDPVSQDGLIVERHQQRLTLTLNRPNAANALAPTVVEAMIDQLDSLQDVRLCVIKANGNHFCAGFDLADIESLTDGDILWRILRIEHLLQKFYHSSVPVIALAQGQAVGAGADLLAACWYRVATGATKIRFPGWNFELALGTKRLTNRVGADLASDMLIDTRVVTATEGLQCGLLSELQEADRFEDTIDAVEKRVMQLSPHAIADMLALTRQDTREIDMAAIVMTAARPGLKQRIQTYQQTLKVSRASQR